jgi:hypothetical protein
MTGPLAKEAGVTYLNEGTYTFTLNSGVKSLSTPRRIIPNSTTGHSLMIAIKIDSNLPTKLRKELPQSQQTQFQTSLQLTS